ncbi:MAG: cysteine--tRNA ligase [Actinobacteria bacterium]|uniref:Cysteine--tRNA ligase n=1 Tax=freshwater metagenome TaxID=449393 RepID=A0A6J6IP41_9ZZZZ|nr:cysteine--tRNA ligase [Actinomycetota bacterium]
MTLRLYDTKSRELKPVATPNGVTSMYCCGPTVYRDAHVGNLRTFLLADLISRALTLSGVAVTLVQNITDVGHMSEDFQEDDKILTQASIEKIDPFEIARKYEGNFHKDLARLNIRPANLYPKASESIEMMQSMIAELIKKDAAYVGSDGSVYFDVHSSKSYGELSGNRLDALKPGHKHETSEDSAKKFHADWALWKAAGNRSQMVWPSPWGLGFPGWHIECSAMSLKLLNSHVDVHVGGIDLRFPHHENERAQSNAITGNESVDIWVHGEHLLFEGRKMSKSSGNVLLIQDVIDRGIDPIALRLCLLENRYRSQMDLTWKSIEAAHELLLRWRGKISVWAIEEGLQDTTEIDPEIESAIENDLDTPKILLRLRAIEKSELKNKRVLFMYADQILGLQLDAGVKEKTLTAQMKDLLEARSIARKEKRWADSDQLRVKLEELGLIIKDTPEGQTWS